jgi:thiol-disulfide isomerase/thioredoxin
MSAPRPRTSGLTVVLALMVATLWSCGGSATSTSGAVSTTTPGPSLPAVTLSSLDGAAVPMRSLVGTPLVINYWYASCPGCHEELPALAAAATTYAHRVSFVGINPRDTPTIAAQDAAAHGDTYRQLLDRTDASIDALGLTGLPTTLFVAADGHIVATVRHAVTAAELDTMITRLLA